MSKNNNLTMLSLYLQLQPIFTLELSNDASAVAHRRNFIVQATGADPVNAWTAGLSAD